MNGQPGSAVGAGSAVTVGEAFAVSGMVGTGIFEAVEVSPLADPNDPPGLFGGTAAGGGGENGEGNGGDDDQRQHIADPFLLAP